ncbi:MAG: VOC family protein [Chitinophagaceae bacterium]|nr:MAG: VOC family protein [Chitinophagaceae bacterium]
MPTFHPYLNFDGNAAQAFEFYKSVFGGEFLAKQKMSDAPGTEALSEQEKNRILHIALPLSSGTILMASDCVPASGHVLTVGNNMYINIAADSREEADRLFNGLSAGGEIEMPMADMFWGDYFGSFKDKFGIQWMINYNAQQS